MAKQDINLGTQPTGVGGDTNRSANLKTNANITELYKAMGGSLNGGNGSVLPSSLPIDKGGTGATTSAAARTALGLGSAATLNAGKNYGEVLRIGYGTGIGSNVEPTRITGEKTFTEYFQELNNLGTGMYSATENEISGEAATGKQNIPRLIYCPLLWVRGTGIQMAFWGNYNDGAIGFTVRQGSASSTTSLRIGHLKTSLNTTVDGNGFIKNASPIVELYADKIELNDEAKLQNITFEKLGIGDYIIKNSSGFAQDGWYVEQPKDANGNIYHVVEYGTYTNGDIWIKTYEQMLDGTRIVADHNKPIDIKENRFISVRLNALPEDTSAPINPTVKDNEGNAAPSRLHELVEGVWVISDENAAILEQERLAAMQPLKRRQFRLTLAMNGYDLNEIEALIDQIEDPMQRTIAQIEWQDATDFERTNPTLLKMAEMMQLTTAQIDQLWAFGLSL